MAEESNGESSFSNERYRQPLLPALEDTVRQDQLRHNKELEQKYPGIKEVLDRMLLKGAPPDIYEELTEDLIEFPVKAAILKKDTYEVNGKHYTYYRPLSQNGNEVNFQKLSSKHAEKVAIEAAAKALGNKHLDDDCILVSLVEPCRGCSSEIIDFGVKTVIFGLSQDDIRGKGQRVNGVVKLWRAAPPGFTAKEFIHETDPETVVIGGYRKDEINDFIMPMDIK